MKHYTMLLLLLLLSFGLIAQDMSIEFSIERKEKLDFQFEDLKDKGIKPAFLNITYRNVSNTPLYCLKIKDNHTALPEVGSFYMPHITYSTERFPYYDYDYYKRRYFVGFQSNFVSSIGFTWNIYNDTTDIEYKKIKDTLTPAKVDITGHYKDGNFIENDMFGALLSDTVNKYDGLEMTLDGIYSYIYRHYYLEKRKNDKEQWYHDSINITEDTIMNNLIDKFVFLKPGETYVDKYDLIGFQITGGTFTFQLDDVKSLDYIETDPVYKNDNKFEIDYYQKKQLPKKVGEYELFTGEFLTNKVTVQFPGIKMKEYP